MERYTSFVTDKDIKELEKAVDKKVVELNREELENNFEKLLIIPAKKDNIVLLVVGDPLTATTHFEFLKSCKKKNVKFKVIHASSIISSVGECGLFIYKYGKTCSVPFFEKSYRPTSFFDIIEDNQRTGAHTLVLLDIKKEKGKYMTINHALKTLLNISKERVSFFNRNTKIVGIAGLGGKNQKIKYGSASKLLKTEFKSKPHCLIIPGKLNSMEEEYLKIYK